MLKLYAVRIAIIGMILFFALVLSVYAGQVCTISKDTIVFRPGKIGEWGTLIKNGMYEEAERCCESCSVPAGTKVYTDSDGIRVIEGKLRGCSGIVYSSYIGNCK